MDCKQAAALLGGWDNLLILTHKRPDGDTIGCAVGLCALLRQLGKTAWLLPNEDATTLFTPYMEGYVAPADFVPQKVVTVDIAGRSLFTQQGLAWLERGIDLAIDHHPSNEGFATYNLVEADKAACGEIVYQLVELMGELTAEIAVPLYLAVSTDTGCFVYGNTTAHTHAVAAALLQVDFPYQAMNKRHFRTKSLKRLKLEQALLHNMECLEEGKIAISHISLDTMAQIQAAEEDAEDIAAFVGQIEGVKVSATIRELSPGECKISLRTDPNYLNATKTCALLGGGGHIAAAGCTVAGTVEETHAAIREAILQVLHGD